MYFEEDNVIMLARTADGTNKKVKIVVFWNITPCVLMCCVWWNMLPQSLTYKLLFLFYPEYGGALPSES
jgi:hypothetical protein